MLVHIKEIVKKAKQKNYAIGAFNTSNLEVTQAILRAAAAKKSPVIVQISESTIAYAGLLPILNLIKTSAQKLAPKIPVAIHLDHGKNLAVIKQCLKAGLTSIHIDASEKPFEQNVNLTKKVALMAHRAGAWVQGELGSIYGKEGLTKINLPKNKDIYLTDPNKVREYLKKTTIDTLAVSVGTIHGYFKGQEKVDQKRLIQITKQTKTPLVLHGASGLNPKNLKTAVKNGVSIVNIDTELRMAFTKTLKQTLKKPIAFYDPRKILSPSTLAVEKTVSHLIDILGSRDKI